MKKYLKQTTHQLFYFSSTSQLFWSYSEMFLQTRCLPCHEANGVKAMQKINQIFSVTNNLWQLHTAGNGFGTTGKLKQKSPQFLARSQRDEIQSTYYVNNLNKKGKNLQLLEHKLSQVGCHFYH